MSDEDRGEVLNLLHERFARVDAQIAALREELGAAIEGLRQEIHGELGVVRARQAEQEIFARGMASFITEVNGALARIERKLNGQ